MAAQNEVIRDVISLLRDHPEQWKSRCTELKTEGYHIRSPQNVTCHMYKPQMSPHANDLIELRTACQAWYVWSQQQVRVKLEEKIKAERLRTERRVQRRERIGDFIWGILERI